MGLWDALNKNNTAPSSPSLWGGLPSTPKPSGSLWSNLPAPVKPGPGPTSTPITDPYFYSTLPQGGAIGRSDQVDSSGKPFFAYRNPGDTATTTDKGRVATVFDPRKPQKLDKNTFYNPRAIEGRQALREALGASYNDDLDHEIALELSGSNNPVNLSLQSAHDNRGPFQQKETALAKQVANGEISLFDAQIQDAKQKGKPLPFTGAEQQKSFLETLYKSLEQQFIPGSLQKNLPKDTTPTALAPQPINPQETNPPLPEIFAGGTKAYDPLNTNKTSETTPSFAAKGTIQDPFIGTGKVAYETIVKYPIRAALTAALTVSRATNPDGVETINPKEDFGKIGELALGGEPINPLQQTYTEARNALAANGYGRFAAPIALIGSTGDVGLNLIPGIGALEKKGFLKLAEATSEAAAEQGIKDYFPKIFNVLKQDPEAFTTFVNYVAKENNPQNLEKTFKAFSNEFMKEQSLFAKGKNYVESIPNKQGGFINIGGRDEEIKAVDNIVTGVNKNNTGTFNREAQLVTILPKPIANIIGDDKIHLSEFVAAKIKGLVKGFPGHPNITDDVIRRLPDSLSTPQKILEDVRKETRKEYLFINTDPTHQIVVEIERKPSGLTEINSIFDSTDKELKRLEGKLPTVYSSGETPSSRIRASQEESAGRGFSAPQNNTDTLPNKTDNVNVSDTPTQATKVEEPLVAKSTKEILADMNENKSLDKAAQEHFDRVRNADLISTERLATDYKYEANKQDYLSKTIAKQADRTPEGIIRKLGRSLNPLKFQDKTTQDIYTDYVADTLVAREMANAELARFDKPQKYDMQSLFDYQDGKRSEFNSKVKKVFDGFYKEANGRGFELDYRDNYLPGVYKNTPEEIQLAARSYLKEQGLSEKAIDDYFAGQKLPSGLASGLKISPNWEKEKFFPNYRTAVAHGLTPKYQNIPALAAYWREQLERSAAGLNLVDKLLSKGKITIVDNAPRGWKVLDTPFSPKLYAAPPELATMINGIFRDEENIGFGAATIAKTAHVSKLNQDIALSAGLPFTNLNFFSAGQAIGSLTKALGSIATLNPSQAASELKAAWALVRANFDGATVKFFEKHTDTIQKMAEQGIDISNRLGTYKDYEAIANNGFWKQVYGKGADLWKNAFNKKTFQSFMPQLYIQTFDDTYKAAIKDGLSEEMAGELAGKTTKAAYGLIGNVGRSRTTEDTLSTIFFAPKFRESLVNTLLNAGKSVTTQLRNPAYSRSRSLLAGAALSFAAYQLINKKTSGHYTWENEPGHEFDIRVALPDDQVMYVPFMPSMFAFPRNIASGAIATAKGDLSTATQKFSSLLSAPLNTAIQVYSNKDYFGNPIYKDTDTTKTKAFKIGKYLGLSFNHPYIKELVNQIDNKKPLYQSISTALEIPVSFSSLTKIQQQQFYDAIDKLNKQKARAVEGFQPTYDKIQALPSDAEKQKAVDALSDEEYSIYKTLRSADKRKETTTNQIDMTSTVMMVRDLIKGGHVEQAQKIVDDLTDEEYKAYASAKKRLGIN